MRWTKPEVNEALATLYLRLNGYFTTGLILHSPDWGENRTELDCVAIRHPNHSQPERGVESSAFLDSTRRRLGLLPSACNPSFTTECRLRQREAASWREDAAFGPSYVVRPVLRLKSRIAGVSLEPRYFVSSTSVSTPLLSVILARPGITFSSGVTPCDRWLPTSRMSPSGDRQTLQICTNILESPESRFH